MGLVALWTAPGPDFVWAGIKEIQAVQRRILSGQFQSLMNWHPTATQGEQEQRLQGWAVAIAAAQPSLAAQQRRQSVIDWLLLLVVVSREKVGIIFSSGWKFQTFWAFKI